ncbi:MAG: Holliday junction branch migration protein RuvA, partial [Lachnospiraceae bacterium]|nr:Holliday junction branch migration protein RuvA [Lachnospiraceae bacterium]
PDADGEGGAEGPEADAAAALTALGYSRPEAVKAVRSAAEEGETDTEGLLKSALKYLL